jgi:riboflavin kinase / FMN adenylyltransferase
MMRSVVTIGVFDGIHIGHRAVIEKVVVRARAMGAKSIVVTFDPHPLKVLSGRHFVPSLVSVKHRIRLIKELGIDKVLVMKFNKKIASLAPEKFIKDIIVKKLNAKEIFVGEDFCFGKGAGAGARALEDISRRFGIKVTIVRHIKKEGAIISSSLIRQLVISGRIDKASRFLGRPYSILGTVVSGSRLARKLGYPTANLNPHHEAIPPSGVYAVKVRFKRRLFKGVMNIGLRPTFYDHGHDKEPSIEVHIFDFSSRIYGKDLEILFFKKLRDEKKFKAIDSLIKQIKMDEGAARRRLAYSTSLKNFRSSAS